MSAVSTRSNDADTTNGVESSSDDHEVAIETYETDDGIVFYDANNPLAWVETDRPITTAEFV